MAPNNTGPSAIEREQIIGMMEKEMELRVEMFNKLVPFALCVCKNDQEVNLGLTLTCFNKCVENKCKESELNMGENSCIDRCVSKYWQVTNLVGQLLGNNLPPM